MRKMTDIITEKDIQQAKKEGACPEAIKWLQEQPRTIQDLKTYAPQWYIWTLHFFLNCPIDLTNLTPHNCAKVMISRRDCPINLTNLTSYSRALVMTYRKDCLINLTGLTPEDRAQVMAFRPDCPIDLTDLDSYERAWVIENRPDYKE